MNCRTVLIWTVWCHVCVKLGHLEQISGMHIMPIIIMIKHNDITEDKKINNVDEENLNK